MEENKLSYNEIKRQAEDAIEHWDALPAWECYKALEKFPEMPEIIELKRKLLAVGFPALPSELANRVMRERVLDFFKVDVNFKERVSTRYTFSGYGEKEAEHKRLREAILQNQERLGRFTISQWLKLFEQRFPPEKSKKDAPQKFLTQSTEVASLGKIEQRVLRAILETYNEEIVHILPDEFDRAVILTAGEAGIPSKSQKRLTPTPQPSAAESLALLEALSKYHQLASQQITGEKIKLKTQVELVRPTLMNWLKYYRSELGIGYHDATQRGEFLYRSENGRKLTSEERERLNLILKSIEEEYPLEIDTARSEIIFPEFQEMAPKRAPERRLVSSPSQKSASLPSGQKPKSFPVAPKPSNLSFHQGLPPSRDLPPEKPISRIAEPSHPSFSFKEMPPIKGMKSAPAFEEPRRGKPAFAELRHGEPAFRERESVSTSLQRDGRSKPAFPDLEPVPGSLRGGDRSRAFWKPSLSQAAPEPTNLSFSSPHVFPEEKERRENWLKQKVAPKRDLPATPRTAPPLQSPAVPQPTAKPAVPPLAPRRSPDLPRPKQHFVPNRFNITPMGYRKEDRE